MVLGNLETCMQKNEPFSYIKHTHTHTHTHTHAQRELNIRHEPTKLLGENTGGKVDTTGTSNAFFR
jgi:hypothetical protein